MRKLLALVPLLVVLPIPSRAQQQAYREKPCPISVKTAVQSTPPAAEAPVPDLPVRRVVLYKNGVGYFEHIGLPAAWRARLAGTRIIRAAFNPGGAAAGEFRKVKWR